MEGRVVRMNRDDGAKRSYEQDKSEDNEGGCDGGCGTPRVGERRAVGRGAR